MNLKKDAGSFLDDYAKNPRPLLVVCRRRKKEGGESKGGGEKFTVDWGRVRRIFVH